jgi:hypothetical protein
MCKARVAAQCNHLAWFVAQRQAQVPSLDVFLDHCVPAFADRRCFATREADQAGGLTFLR